MKNKGFFVQLGSGLLLAVATLSLAACADIIYRVPAFNVAGRPIPPSQFLQRVLASYTSNGSSGGLEIIDGFRDTRSNVQDTIPAFFIKGYSGTLPTQIISFPEQLRGYVVDASTGAVASVNYGTETSSGTVASFPGLSPSVAVAPVGTRFVGAMPASGTIQVVDIGGGSYTLNLPNVQKVAVNQGNSVILAMVRNSDTLYRVIKLPASPSPIFPPGFVDCEPLLLPVYCIVPVAGTFDHPSDAYFSVDGSTAYVLNCGPECGGKTASVSFLQEGALNINNGCIEGFAPVAGLCATLPPATIPPAMLSLGTGIPNPIPVPGGVTTALSDGTNLYVAGQQLLGDGLFSGQLSVINLTSYAVTAQYPISDGTHSKMLFADDNTLWIGAQQCANGERASKASQGTTTQDANTNCLTRFALGTPAMTCPNTPPSSTVYTPVPYWQPNHSYAAGSEMCEGTTLHIVATSGTSGGSPPTWNTAVGAVTKDGGATWATLGPLTQAQIVPGITPNSSTFNILYPNTNQNFSYYGSLTGICWVQTFHKIYTAYGGQIHAFDTVDAEEINNQFITVQGTVLDVAYMDALTNSAN